MRILTVLLLLLSGVAWAGTANQIPNDEYRGTWFDTIDEDARPYAYNFIQDNVRKGPNAMRFELREGDCYTSPNWDDCTQERDRTEIRERWKPKLDREIWYSFSFYIPNDYQYIDNPKQMFFQWHGGVWGPNAYLMIKKSQVYLDILTQKHKTTTQYNLGKWEKGKWHDVIVNVRWTTKSNGFMKVWKNGKYLVEYKGATMDPETYATGSGPHVKYGIYISHKSRWAGPGKRPTHVLYFDEYRRGYKYPQVDIDNHNGD